MNRDSLLAVAGLMWLYIPQTGIIDPSYSGSRYQGFTRGIWAVTGDNSCLTHSPMEREKLAKIIFRPLSLSILSNDIVPLNEEAHRYGLGMAGIVTSRTSGLS